MRDDADIVLRAAELFARDITWPWQWRARKLIVMAYVKGVRDRAGVAGDVPAAALEKLVVQAQILNHIKALAEQALNDRA